MTTQKKLWLTLALISCQDIVTDVKQGPSSQTGLLLDIKLNTFRDYWSLTTCVPSKPSTHH
jgi:hypothetical protein